MNILGHLFARSNTYCCCATTTTAATTSTMLLLRPRPLPNSANVYLFVGTAAAAAFLLFPLRINNNKKKEQYIIIYCFIYVYIDGLHLSVERNDLIQYQIQYVWAKRGQKKLLRTLGIQNAYTKIARKNNSKPFCISNNVIFLFESCNRIKLARKKPERKNFDVFKKKGRKKTERKLYERMDGQ